MNLLEIEYYDVTNAAHQAACLDYLKTRVEAHPAFVKGGDFLSNSMQILYRQELRTDPHETGPMIALLIEEAMIDETRKRCGPQVRYSSIEGVTLGGHFLLILTASKSLD